MPAHRTTLRHRGGGKFAGAYSNGTIEAKTTINPLLPFGFYGPIITHSWTPPSVGVELGLTQGGARVPFLDFEVELGPWD